MGTRCEVCDEPVREGLRFCSGLHGCFMTWWLREKERVNREAREKVGELLEATSHLREP